MSNGMNLTESEFVRLPQKEQHLVLFKNTEEIKKNFVSCYKDIEAVKGQTRLQWVFITIIGGTLVWIAQQVFGK